MIRKMKDTYKIMMTRAFWLFPIRQNQLMFWNFFGKGYGCNGKYICEYIIKHKPDYKMVWVVDGKAKYQFPAEVRPVKKNSVKYFYYLATSKVLIDNQHKDLSFKKRRGQYLVKTWHAMLGLKKIGLDNPQTDEVYRQKLKYNNEITDYMISNSEYIEEKFKRVFDYSGPFLKTGFPRVDILVNGDKKTAEEIRKKLGVEKNTRVLLYAPTFREGKVLDYYDIDFEKVLGALEEKTGQKWVALVKYHPHLLKAKIPDMGSGKVRNVTEHDDIQELMLIADILISDYSNVIFEFGLTGRPVFLYAKDYAQYKKERDFYFDYQKLPFPLAKSNDELVKEIMEYDEKAYRAKVKEFYAELKYAEDGRASERLVRELDKLTGRGVS